MSVRVRFAPSPTGPLHIGGVRTALYNYLFAKKHGGTFIIRIEDTDQNRFVPGAENYIFETLNWVGVTPTESPVHGGEFGPYRQSERKAIYKDFALQLINNDTAYYAFDSAEDLEKMRENLKAQGVPSPQYNAVTRQYMKNSITLPADEVQKKLAANEPYVIRIKMPRNEEIKFEDQIRGWVSFQTNQLDDKVLFKSDGMPTYHLANVVDDYLMKITHVIRGEEWLPSAPTHVFLYRSFGWENVMPQFAHLPLILRPDGNGKLSKRDGDRLGFPVFSLNWDDIETGEKSTGFRERGFFPDALINFLAFLGWNPGTTQEIFSMQELIEAFSIERIGKAGARFDFDKLKWFNQQYFKLHRPEETAQKVKVMLAEKGIHKDDLFILEFTKQMLERVTFFNDFYDLGKYYFSKPAEYDVVMLQKKWKAGKKEFFAELIKEVKNIDSFNTHSFDAAVKQFLANNNLGMGDLGPLLRIALAGTMQGPPVFEMAALIGKQETIERLEIALNKFDNLVTKE
jgi:glutamyl-tRNA synthetase